MRELLNFLNSAEDYLNKAKQNLAKLETEVPLGDLKVKTEALWDQYAEMCGNLEDKKKLLLQILVPLAYMDGSRVFYVPGCTLWIQGADEIKVVYAPVDRKADRFYCIESFLKSANAGTFNLFCEKMLHNLSNTKLLLKGVQDDVQKMDVHVKQLSELFERIKEVSK